MNTTSPRGGRYRHYLITGGCVLAAFGAGYLTGNPGSSGNGGTREGGAVSALAAGAGSSRTEGGAANTAAPGLTHLIRGGWRENFSAEEAADLYSRVLQEPNPLSRRAAFAMMLTAADHHGMESIRKAVGDHYNKGGRLPEDLAELWHMREGQFLTAEQFTASLPKEPNGELHSALARKMRGWAGADAAASRAFIAALEPGSIKQRLQKEWLDGLSNQGVREVFDSLSSGEKLNVMDRYVSELHDRGGLHTAAVWVDTLSKDETADPAVVEKAFTNVAARYAQNPGGAAAGVQYFLDHADAPYLTGPALSTSIYYLGRNAPGPTLEMLAELNTRREDLRGMIPEQINSVVRYSSAGSLNTVAGWLNEHPDYALRDHVAVSLVQRLRSDDPVAAVHWAKTISDPGLKRSVQDLLPDAGGGP